MTQPWMPLYVADYLADTRRLSTLEHGAYLLLIMDYWRNGGLPADDRDLARIAGLSAKAWSAMRAKIAALFQDGWRHKRIDAEMAKAVAKSSTAKAAVDERWRRERERNANEQSDAHTNVLLSQSESQPEKENASRSSSDAEDPPKPRRQKSESDERLLDRITDLWNAWAAPRGSPQIAHLTGQRAIHCRRRIAELMQHGHATPEAAFAWLLVFCDESFFVRGSPRRRLEFDQLLKEGFVARMIEGSFKFEPPPGARKWAS